MTNGDIRFLRTNCL